MFLLGIGLVLPFVMQGAPMDCSCYSFHEDGLTWTAARQSCQYHGGDLVSLETEHEWEVIKDYIQNLTNLFNNDWHIGLHFNATVARNWTWVSGKPLSIERWQPWQPRDGAPYVVMAKNYPPGTKGLFNDVREDIFAGFICEKPADCSKSSLLCKDPGKITEAKPTTASNTRSSSTSLLLRRNPAIRTERTTSTRTAKTGDTVIMVEKVQLPSGFIHWTVTVIPLACVIVVLICVIGFLLWRLKQRTRKQNGEITVNSIHYDVQTRSLLHQEGRVDNLRGADQMGVHFQEPNNREDPKYHALTQTTSNENNRVEYAALYKKPGEVPISRRLAIRRKNSSELTSKYPLNKSGNDDETEGAYRVSHMDTPNQGGEREHSSHEYHALASDYDEPLSIIKSDHENTEKPDCSEDELSYLEIIP